jgi:hypothetical protein
MSSGSADAARFGVEGKSDRRRTHMVKERPSPDTREFSHLVVRSEEDVKQRSTYKIPGKLGIGMIRMNS